MNEVLAAVARFILVLNQLERILKKFPSSPGLDGISLESWLFGVLIPLQPHPPNIKL